MTSNSVMPGKHENLGAFPFVLGGLSFIPLIGVPFGIVAVVWGLFTKRTGGNKLAVVGVLRICFTVVVYGSLFYFGLAQRAGIYDELRTKMAQNNINSLVTVLEFYRTTHGDYPASLDVLSASLGQESVERVYMLDPRVTTATATPVYFYYQRVDPNHYYLRGVGSDGEPFSRGSLAPQLNASADKIGLLTDRPAGQP
jgi:hypothetical protein